MKNYSMIVIGGGMTGLSAALTWTMNMDSGSYPVLLIDKNSKVGGMVATYRRKQFYFDTTQMIPNIDDFIRYFRLDIDLIKIADDFLHVMIVNPDNDQQKLYKFNAGFHEFTRDFVNYFPESERNIKKFMNYCLAMFNQINKLKYNPGAIDIVKMIFTCRKIIINANKTFEQFFTKFKIYNPDILAILDIFAFLTALTRNKADSLIIAGVMNSLLEGAYRTNGNFELLPESMINRYIENGGELLLKKEVVKIITDNGKAVGVKLDSGETIYSNTIISTIDVQQAMNNLVGIDVIEKYSPKYARKVMDTVMTPSSININFGLNSDIKVADINLGKGYNFITTGAGSFEKLFDEYENGRTGFSYDCFQLGISFPYLLVKEKPYINVCIMPVPMGDWKVLRQNDKNKYNQEKDKWADFVVKIFEKYIMKDFSRYIDYIDIATPTTISRFCKIPSGAMYDMASVPSNFGNKRLSTKTPIKGLYQPKFSHGIFGTINGGMQAVDMILKGKVMNGNSRFKLTDNEKSI